jgi:hypothetical protein
LPEPEAAMQVLVTEQPALAEGVRFLTVEFLP